MHIFSRRAARQRQALSGTFFVVLLISFLVLLSAWTLPSQPAFATAFASRAAPTATSLTSIDMFDTQRGWAITSTHHVLRTSDGASHWKDVTPPGLANAGSFAPDFFSVSTAWLASSIGVFRTSNSGATWQRSSFSVRSPSELEFVDLHHGWLLVHVSAATFHEEVNLFRSTDGGVTWKQVATTDNHPGGTIPLIGDKTGFRFINASTGWMTAVLPSNFVWFYVTHDGGFTWHHQGLPLPAGYSSEVDLYPPTFFSATTGILPVQLFDAQGPLLDVYVTHDGGTTWRGTTPTPAFAFLSDFITLLRGWAANGQQPVLQMTSDGGRHWTRIAAQVPANFNGFSLLNFVSNTTGWAITFTATTSFLLKTTDGGRVWKEVPVTVG
jgi:photosystem II stability/assembly factor-like uncharacterized protein